MGTSLKESELRWLARVKLQPNPYPSPSERARLEKVYQDLDLDIRRVNGGGSNTPKEGSKPGRKR